VVAARVECPLPHESVLSRDSGELQGRLRRLLDENYSSVWRALRRLGVTPDSAEDAAQQVFIILSTKLDGIKPEDERRYMFGVVVRVAANMRRGRARRREVTDDDVAEPIDESAVPADALLEKREANALLERALSSMDEDVRVVFTFFELEEMTLVEIANILDIPVGTATSRLRRGREQFRAIAARMRVRGETDV
jgi:RNA polymerase sigma-70 factor (ECF subfamily)